MRSPLSRVQLTAGAVALAILPFLTPAEARAGDTSHTVPEVRPVQIDGRAPVSEWADALALPLGKGEATLRLQQYRGTLMLAFESDHTWTAGSVLTIYFCLAGPKAGGRSPDCVRMDYEPFRHDRVHALVYGHDPAGYPIKHPGKVIARASMYPGRSQAEFALPLTLLGLTKDKRVPIRLAVQWSRRGGRSVHYPATLDFRAKAGQVARDYASAKNWATLTGWGNPEGPGAYSQDDWKILLEHDLEITRRGVTAHDEVKLLREEWKKTVKKDSELVPEVIDNLRWIREHERLTAEDVLAMATLWRFLNRYERATAMMDVLVDTTPSRSIRQRALYERALSHHGAQRFDAEIADWTQLAKGAGALNRNYVMAARKAGVLKTRWQDEQKARAADETDASLPRVRLVTARGQVEIVLYAKDVPNAVKHFLDMVASKFYDGTLFHRVKGNFMAQGGDPKSRDMGCEFAGTGSSTVEIPMELNKRHTFFRGTLAFARLPHKKTNGSQFFIMTAPDPNLGEYTVFGHVVSGMPAVDRLEQCDKLKHARVVSK